MILAIQSSPGVTNSPYSIDVIRDEARQLVQKGVISRRQSIHALLQYITPAV